MTVSLESIATYSPVGQSTISLSTLPPISPLIYALRDISSDWGALTPGDRPEITYHEIDEIEPGESVAADRGFEFELVSRIEDEQQDLVFYEVVAALYLQSDARGHKDATDAIVEEGDALARAVELRTQWPGGVFQIVVGEVDSERDENDDVTVLIPISLTVREA